MSWRDHRCLGKITPGTETLAGILAKIPAKIFSCQDPVRIPAGKFRFLARFFISRQDPGRKRDSWRDPAGIPVAILQGNLLVPKMRERKVLFPLVVDFNPHLPNISKIIKSRSHIHLIYNSPTLAEIFPKGSIIPSYRRAKNIKELLAGRKRSNYNNHDNSVTGCCKCNSKCDLCKNYFKESKIFHNACTNRFYTIRKNLNCKSKDVIYVATCKKCNIQYGGSIANEFKVRFRSHKSAMLIRPPSCELAVHFNKEEHHMSDFEFIVIEKIVNERDNNIDRRLLNREVFWCSQLCTLQPY